jgi:Asp-tRNA(Asn)/Glu-tRNA(Gln) amidotransferase A subunit family amidase
MASAQHRTRSGVVTELPNLGTDGILFEPAVDLAARIQTRELSVSELLDATWQQIHRLNPILNAIVTSLEDQSREEGRRADQAIKQGGYRGPLHGLPFTVKDLIATAGIRTTAGSTVLASHIPNTSAPAIARLQAAGAILLGKSNCPEFALDLHTGNRLFGDTWNPWNPRYTSGGSSGGDSAAVAAGMAAFGVGTDYGGSVRWPAHCTGLAAFRPTPGLVPSTGQLPYSTEGDLPPPNSLSLQNWLQTMGPLARSAKDLAMLVRVMAGPDNLDSHAVPVDLGDPDSVNIAHLSVAWFDEDGTIPVRSDVKATVADAASALSQRGLEVVNERPPGFDEGEAAYSALRAAEGLPDHRTMVAGHEAELTDYLRVWLERPAKGMTVTEYRALGVKADSVRARVAAFMEDWPILLLPVASIPAFVPDSWDFVVEGTQVARFNIETCCRVVTLLRTPAAVVACGTTREGLPIGVQVVGRPYRDHEVMAVAIALEEAFGLWRPPVRPS